MLVGFIVQDVDQLTELILHQMLVGFMLLYNY